MRMEKRCKEIPTPEWLRNLCWMAFGAYAYHVISRIIELYFN